MDGYTYSTAPVFYLPHKHVLAQWGVRAEQPLALSGREVAKEGEVAEDGGPRLGGLDVAARARVCVCVVCVDVCYVYVID